MRSANHGPIWGTGALLEDVKAMLYFPDEYMLVRERMREPATGGPEEAELGLRGGGELKEGPRG